MARQYNASMHLREVNVGCFGGGTGLPSLLGGLKANPWLKLNAVVARGFNEDDVVPLAALTLARDWHVRFIETMPLGIGEVAQLARTHVVPNAESRGRIEAALGALTPLPAHDPADEARNYRLPGGRGVVGFISPVSEPYCGTCNRMRLTADGKFHLCLLHDDGSETAVELRETDAFVRHAYLPGVMPGQRYGFRAQANATAMRSRGKLRRAPTAR